MLTPGPIPSLVEGRRFNELCGTRVGLGARFNFNPVVTALPRRDRFDGGFVCLQRGKVIALISEAVAHADAPAISQGANNRSRRNAARPPVIPLTNSETEALVGAELLAQVAAAAGALRCVSLTLLCMTRAGPSLGAGHRFLF